MNNLATKILYKDTNPIINNTFIINENTLRVLYQFFEFFIPKNSKKLARTKHNIKIGKKVFIFSSRLLKAPPSITSL